MKRIGFAGTSTDGKRAVWSCRTAFIQCAHLESRRIQRKPGLARVCDRFCRNKAHAAERRLAHGSSTGKQEGKRAQRRMPEDRAGSTTVLLFFCPACGRSSHQYHGVVV